MPREKSNTTSRAFVLCHEGRDESPRFFIRLGIGIFWECGPFDMAKRFTTRQAAAKVMQDAGKNRQGWRVVAVEGR